MSVPFLNINHNFIPFIPQSKELIFKKATYELKSKIHIIVKVISFSHVSKYIVPIEYRKSNMLRKNANHAFFPNADGIRISISFQVLFNPFILKANESHFSLNEVPFIHSKRTRHKKVF